jgi:hypothetical protein
VAGLAKARTAMSHQRGLDGKALINIRPAYLVVPTSLEVAAEQLLAQSIVPTTASDVVPGSLRSLAVIAEPRLDPPSGAVPWYLVASPAAIDTIEYAHLEGQEGVALETRIGFDVDRVRDPRAARLWRQARISETKYPGTPFHFGGVWAGPGSWFCWSRGRNETTSFSGVTGQALRRAPRIRIVGRWALSITTN